jgi:hypothetical protein
MMGERRRKMRKIARLAMVLAVFSMTTLNFAQSQTGHSIQEPAFRVPFDLKLAVDKEHYYEQHFDKVPYVIENDVYLFAMESFGINVTIADNRISGVTYQRDSAKSDVWFSFSQEVKDRVPEMMMLVTRNGLKRRLMFDALMTMPDKKGIFKTSIIPIDPGLSSYESWPHPIVQLVLRNFRFAESNSAVPR